MPRATQTLRTGARSPNCKGGILMTVYANTPASAFTSERLREAIETWQDAKGTAHANPTRLAELIAERDRREAEAKANLATIPPEFWALVDVRYWAMCHEDHDESDEQNQYAAFLYVDAEMGLCSCCGVDYRNEVTRPKLAEMGKKYPGDVILRIFNNRKGI